MVNESDGTRRGRNSGPDDGYEPGPTFPVMLDVRGRRCVVVGATDIARARVAVLTAAGAEVVAFDDLPAPSAAATASVTERPFDGAWLVFAATGSNERDAEIARQATAAGVWANAHDQPGACGFHMAARLTRGPLEIAVGTGAVVPALAVRVRNLIAELVGEEVVPLIEQAAAARRAARAEGISPFELDWDDLLAPVLAAIDARIAARS